MKVASKITLLLITATVIIVGCRKKQCDQIIPSISFTELQLHEGDSATLVFYFKDCDGNIGLREADSLAPHDFNLFMEYYEKVNGNWEHIEVDPPFYYRIPKLLDDDEEESVEGDIEISLPFYYNTFSANDTFKFQFYIKDYALNESNIAETGEIVKP